ncbi:MAG TPA: hypothetical protein VJT71_03025 [Pyrinomonadaceae bacterium]|nr:hypothetical protein [Pyrinomonadaceae bacterium]
MIIKLALLASLFLTLSLIGFAQTQTNRVDPDVIIRDLYFAQNAGSGPFFQTKSRAVVDKYFRKDLADLIWKDAVQANGEVGAIDFDPLYGSQDPQITEFHIMETGWGGDIKYGGEDDAVVQVTFKDSGKERMVSYQFKRGRDKVWKIFDVHYRDDNGQVKLAEILTKASAASQAAPSESSVQDIRGELQAGKTESLLLYFGSESGDYAAYCFANRSQAGRRILAVCKKGQQCAVKATVGSYACKVPGLEADLSDSGRILRVQSVRSLGRRK